MAAQVALNTVLQSGGGGNPGSTTVSEALPALVEAGPALLSFTSTAQQNELASILLARLSAQFPPPEQQQQQQSSAGIVSSIRAKISGSRSRGSSFNSNGSNSGDARMVRAPARCQPELELLRNLSRTANARLAETDALFILINCIERSLSHVQVAAALSVRTISPAQQEQDDADADMAMRTLNNVLMLHQDARAKFSTELGEGPVSTCGAKTTAALLRCIAKQAQQQAMLVFLAARLLFFSTLFENPFVTVAIEEEGVVGSCAEALRSLAPSTSAEAAQATTELLKLAFNISLYYPRLRPDKARAWRQKHEIASGPESGDASTSSEPTAGEAWADELNGLVEPTIQLFSSSPSFQPDSSGTRPPLQAPVQQAVSLMLNMPTSLSLRHSKIQPRSTTSTALPELPIITRLYDLLALAMHRYLPEPGIPIHAQGQTRQYATGDPDSETTLSAARSQAARDGLGGPAGDPEIGLEPLVLLARKYVTEDEGSSNASASRAKGGEGAARLTARESLRSRILPDDLHRSISPHKQPTLTGLLIRLMSSVMFPRLARAAGELLLAICNGNPTELSDAVGYGPAAGFLALQGACTAFGGAASDSGSTPVAPTRRESVPSASTISSRAGRPVHPITGRFADITDGESGRDGDGEGNGGGGGGDDDAALADMTPEEREREAERLFVLFERLNRTGVVQVGNPARDPDARAKVEALTEEEERREREREEAADEAEALRDLEAYKKRRQGGGA
ncbi:hypothetical protein V8E36_003288 [Tilletia maclaganii]